MSRPKKKATYKKSTTRKAAPRSGKKSTSKKSVEKPIEISPVTGKPKKKPRGKPMPKLVPKNTPKRKKDIQEFIAEAEKREVQPDDNPYSLRGTGGRPRMYSSVDEWIERSELYFEYIQGKKELRKTKVPANNRKGYIEIEEEVWVRKPEPVTITGYGLFMGFAGRQGLDVYKKGHKEFMGIVNYYIALIVNGYEKNLHGSNSHGSQFALKNIDNWQDRTEVFNDFSENVVKGFNYIVPTPPAEETETDPRNDENDLLK